MGVKYSKWSSNITTFPFPGPRNVTKIWDFWFETKPSGNPVLKASERRMYENLAEKKLFTALCTELISYAVGRITTVSSLAL
jgi:hypothetical protein